MARTPLALLLPILAVALAAGAPVAAAPAVEVQGLFPGRAVLTIDGQRRLLKVGERSPEGVELLAADSDGARVRVGDRTIELGLSERVGTRFAEPEAREVRVNRDSSGHYRVAGAINGNPVLMMVDTGATILAMSSRHADAIGLDYEGTGRRGQVTTAGGVSRSYSVELASVTVGGITVRDVRAAVVEGQYPQEILLGMSFLRHVGLSESDGVLTLRQEF